MFNNYVPWGFYQGAGQLHAFPLGNSKNVINHSANPQVQYIASHAGFNDVQLIGNNQHQSTNGKLDHAIPSKGTKKKQNIHKNCEYAVQPNGTNINQIVYKNSEDSQTPHLLHNHNYLSRKNFPDHNPPSKLAQLLRNNDTKISLRNMNSQCLNQNTPHQQVKCYSRGNSSSKESQFKSNVAHVNTTGKVNNNNNNNSGEANVSCNLQLASTQVCKKLNKQQKGVCYNNASSICLKRNLTNCNSPLRKGKTEETFKQQIWVKNIESLNASTINEISPSSATEKPKQIDQLNKISGSRILQYIGHKKILIKKNCIRTATANILAVNQKDEPQQNTMSIDTFPSNSVSTNGETMNSTMNIVSNPLKQINENENEPNLDITKTSNTISEIFINDSAKNLNASSSVSKNLELTDLNKEENSVTLHTNIDTKQTDLNASSLPFSQEEFENNTVDTIIKKKPDNELNHSFNKSQKRGKKQNYITSIEDNDMEEFEELDSLPLTKLVNFCQTQDKNSFKCMEAKVESKELQNENSATISNDSVQSNKLKASTGVAGEKLNKEKMRKISKVPKQKRNALSSRKRIASGEGKAKKCRKIANSKQNKKDQCSVKDNASVGSSGRKKILKSNPRKKNDQNAVKSKCKMQQKLGNKEKSKVSPNKNDYSDLNRHRVKANASDKGIHKNVDQTHGTKRGREKKAQLPVYFSNSLIDRKKLDLLIQYVEGSGGEKPSADCDMKTAEISRNSKDFSGIANADDASSDSGNAAMRPADIKQENACDAFVRKGGAGETASKAPQLTGALPAAEKEEFATTKMVQVFKKFIGDKDDSGTNSEAEELREICRLANLEDSEMFSDKAEEAENGDSRARVFDEKLRELKNLGSDKCIGCESMAPMDKFWLKVTTGELKCAECLIPSRRGRERERKMQWKLLRENEELKLENLTLKHKIRKWIESNAIKGQTSLSGGEGRGKPEASDAPPGSVEKENKNCGAKGKRGRKKLKEAGLELEGEIDAKVSKRWSNAKGCAKPKRKGRAALYKKHA